MLKKSCLKVCDKAAVFFHYFSSALLHKELRPFRSLSCTLPFFSGKGTKTLKQHQMLYAVQESEKGCLLSVHWLEEILHLLKWFHIQLLDLNIGIKLQLHKATPHLCLFCSWICLGTEWRRLILVNIRLLPMHMGHFACSQILSLKQRAFSGVFQVIYFCRGTCLPWWRKSNCCIQSSWFMPSPQHMKLS